MTPDPWAVALAGLVLLDTVLLVVLRAVVSRRIDDETNRRDGNP
jgi:hypothetical protein